MTLCTFHLANACVVSPDHQDERGRARPDELDRRLQARLDALGPAPRAELLHVLMLLDFDRADRADRIGEFAGLSIDREEDRTLRVVLVGMLREAR